MIFYKRYTRLCISLAALVLLGLGLWQSRWVVYLWHLAMHQWHAVASGIELKKALQLPELKPSQRKKIQLIIEAREYARQLYQLDDTTSYEKLVFLERETLAWNITVAEPLAFKTRKFTFPFVGSFGYLGFFSPELLRQWRSFYETDGYDVFESRVSAYSTLGFFADPVFSTYLQYHDYSLARLVLHEIAHEKLYFRDDTALSESLASYIDKIAARRFIKETRGISLPTTTRQDVAVEMKKYWQIVDSYKAELHELYESERPRAEKLRRKREIYSQLRGELTRQKKSFRFTGAANWLLSNDEINNAALLQVKRYTPHQTGFGRILAQCNNDLLCWFGQLERLKACSPEQRKPIYNEDIELEKVLQKCQS